MLNTLIDGWVSEDEIAMERLLRSVTSWDAPRRPERPAYAAQLRFELSTKVLGLEHQGPTSGVLQAIDPAREVAARKRTA